MSLYRYRLYGLNVESTRAIQLLDEGDFANPDVRVDWGPAVVDALHWERRSSADLDRRRSLRVYAAEADGVRWVKICYATVAGEFALIADEDGNRVTVQCDETVPASDRDSYFVGPVMGAILRLRGTLVLHASAVEVDGRAIGFVGRKYSGKSTHAAAFFRRGHRVLADDMAALSRRAGAFSLASGYSRLRVRPGTAELIAPDYEARLAPVYSGRDSYYAPLAGAFREGSLPLAAIYLLGSGDGASVRALRPFQSLALLGQNTFGNYAVTPANRKDEFAQLCRLAADVPVRALGVQYDIANLPAQCDAVLRDIHALER